MAKTFAFQLRRISKTSYGIRQKLLQRLYYGTLIPKALYGVEVWITPMHGECHTSSGKRRRKDSVGGIRPLAQAQRMAALAVAGALRSTPTDLLEADLNMLVN